MLKKVVLPITLAFSLAFSSVSVFGAEWYDSSVKSLTDRKIITGTEKVDETITRGELASLLVKAKGLKTASVANPFSDLSSDHKYYNDILTLYSNNIYFGSQDNGVLTAKADSSLTRQDAAAYFVRTFTLSGDKATISFTDAASISDYAREPIAVLVGKKIVSGHENGTFGPKETLTRAQAYVMLENSILVSKDQPPTKDTEDKKTTSSTGNNRPGNSSGGGSNNGTGGNGSSTITEAELKKVADVVVGKINTALTNVTATDVVVKDNGDYVITIDNIAGDSNLDSIEVTGAVVTKNSGNTYKIVFTIPAAKATAIIGDGLTGTATEIEYNVKAKKDSVYSVAKKVVLTTTAATGDKIFDAMVTVEADGAVFNPGLSSPTGDHKTGAEAGQTNAVIKINVDGSTLSVADTKTLTLAIGADTYTFAADATTALSATSTAPEVALFIGTLTDGTDLLNTLFDITGTGTVGDTLNIVLTAKTTNAAVYTQTVVDGATLTSNDNAGAATATVPGDNTVVTPVVPATTTIVVANPAPTNVKGQFEINIATTVGGTTTPTNTVITLKGITKASTKDQIATAIENAITAEGIAGVTAGVATDTVTLTYVPGGVTTTGDEIVVTLVTAS